MKARSKLAAKGKEKDKRRAVKKVDKKDDKKKRSKSEHKDSEKAKGGDRGGKAPAERNALLDALRRNGAAGSGGAPAAPTIKAAALGVLKHMKINHAEAPGLANTDESLSAWADWVAEHSNMDDIVAYMKMMGIAVKRDSRAAKLVRIMRFMLDVEAA